MNAQVSVAADVEQGCSAPNELLLISACKFELKTAAGLLPHSV
jgi:hypothetical protein